MTTLAIAGWRIRLECDSPALGERIAARYAVFLVPDESVCEAAVSVMLDPALPGGNWKQFPVIRQGDVCTLDVPGACGTIALNSLQASLRLGVEAFEVALELFLEVFCAYLAFRLGGLLVHGAALLLDGKAHLFVGLGGRGKSSVVALSPHALALNDDLVVLRPVEVGWRAVRHAVLECGDHSACSGRLLKGLLRGSIRWRKIGGYTLSPYRWQLPQVSWWRIVRWSTPTPSRCPR